eukprot:6183016-Pleurochrysis_carterae.AAC.2
MPSRSGVCGGCIKCRLGSGTATSFLRWLLGTKPSTSIGRTGQVQATASGVLSGGLSCRYGWLRSLAPAASA